MNFANIFSFFEKRKKTKKELMLIYYRIIIKKHLYRQPIDSHEQKLIENIPAKLKMRHQEIMMKAAQLLKKQEG